MGLFEITLLGLCFNATCPGDPDPLSFKQQQYLALAEELRQETLVITTLKNGDLSGSTFDNGTRVGTGVAFALIEILKDKFKFNYTVVQPKENVFGATTDGVYNMLLNNEAHIAAAFLPVVGSYQQDIHYSPSFDTGDWVVLMKRPKESATGSGLLAPFTAPVWLLIILSLLVVGPIIYLLILLQSRLCRDDNNKVFPLPSCIWFVYGALLKQGSTLNPITDSSRLLFSTWWIFITILTAFYTANLTAFLTLSKFTLPVSEPKDIAEKHYKWVSNKGNSIEDVLLEEERNKMTIETKRRLLTNIGPSYSYLDVADEVILERYVTDQNMMFIRERPIVDYVMYEDYKNKTKAGIQEDQRCTFVITKWSVTTLARAFAYNKNFKYARLFDSTIQHLVESGIIKFKLREELPDTEICPLNLGNKERRLRNSDLIMTYMIVGGGLVISALIFCIEVLLIYFKQRNLSLNNNNRPVTKNLNIFNLYQNNSDKLYNKKPFVTPPPSYNTLFNPQMTPRNKDWKKKLINGREYWIVNSNLGQAELIPVRTPSALLFQYSN